MSVVKGPLLGDFVNIARRWVAVNHQDQVSLALLDD